ncbi:MAG: hypothetical protein CFK52_06295 [Chloracidobacterium sp. CP2_5A]|nr:MAG: hypothetical protein CFK52_06295 [Chloracidobacterium sp. CP2_5A]
MSELPRRFLSCYEAHRFPQPAEMAATPDATLPAIDLSRAKASYIKDLAAMTAAGERNFSRFPRLSDEDIIARLARIKGVGAWTARMFFSLGRLDVLPAADLGVRRGIQ